MKRLSERSDLSTVSVREAESGFTLIEVIVIVGIIGVLMSLLLPAVQSARESARGAACQNQLRQIAIASQSHIEAQGFLPSGGWSGSFLADPRRGYGSGQPGGWAFSILEYCELAALRERAAADPIDSIPLGEGLQYLFQSAPPVFYCPSRRAARAYPFKRAGNGGWSLSVGQQALLLPAVTKSDYAANSGDALYSAAESFSNLPSMWVPANYDALQTRLEWTDTSNERSRFFQSGISFYRSEVRPKDITDGLSLTYLVGEKFMHPRGYEDINELNDVELMGDNQSVWVGYEWDNHRVAWNFSSKWGPEDYQPRLDAEEPGVANIFAFGSSHPGGFYMAFCDGSVQRISYDIHFETHRRQANRIDRGL